MATKKIIPMNINLQEEMEFSYSQTHNDIQIDFISGGYVMSISEVRTHFPMDYLIHGHDEKMITVGEYLKKIPMGNIILKAQSNKIDELLEVLATDDGFIISKATITCSGNDLFIDCLGVKLTLTFDPEFISELEEISDRFNDVLSHLKR